MARENFVGIVPLSYLTGAAVTKWRAVKFSAARTVIHTAAITDQAAGVALETADSGAQVSILPCGPVVKMTAAAAIAAGAEVMPDSGGGGKVATAAGATARSIGVAVEAAGADGDVVEVMMFASPKGPANS